MGGFIGLDERFVRGRLRGEVCLFVGVSHFAELACGYSRFSGLRMVARGGRRGFWWSSPLVRLSWWECLALRLAAAMGASSGHSSNMAWAFECSFPDTPKNLRIVAANGAKLLLETTWQR